jgi:hypothetical protein
MTTKRLIAAGIAAATMLGIGASGSGAVPGNSYLCYSKFQTDPGVWSDAPANSGGNLSSFQLVALGYWKPFATKTTPTNTQLPGGWFLHCNPPSATIQSGAPLTIIGGAGETVTDPTLASQPGYYPMAP